ncbi:MAG: C25 family cysteine peptidase [Cyclobacteriaceae bacterium]
MNKSPFVFPVIFLLLVCLHANAWAQYANDWIDFGKEHYKVTVASDGAYRLSFTDLQNAGFPVGSIDPRRIQLYHRGVEQAIIVQGQADAQFNSGDYIEFYGKKNDGVNDTRLYTAANLQPHLYHNLYSDTSAYFLTWNQSIVQGKRMSTFSEVNVTSIPKETFHYNEQLQVFSNEYSTGLTISGVLQYTQFDEGEGWTGSTICIGNSGCTGQQDFMISNLAGGVVPAGVPQLELLLVGRDALNHLAEVYVGPSSGSLRLLTTESFINYQVKKIELPLEWADISAGGQLTVRVKALGVGGVRDRLSVSYIKVTHPQNFDMASQNSKWFTLEEKVSNKSYIELTNPEAGLSVWDITDPNTIQIIGTNPTGPNTSAVVPNTVVSRKLYVKNNFLTPVIKRTSLRQIFPSAHNYIIISNKALMKPALGYADAVKEYGGYRASAEGGGYDTLVVSMDQLYNQFNYGESSTSAIYEFMKFMVEGGDPKYLFLIGKGLNVSQGYFRKTVFGPNDLKDLVPSAGMPGSDMAFTAGLNGTTFEPAVSTGRITASTPTQVAAYLNKVKETDALGFDELWRKDVLHLSGGIQPFELTTFKQYMDNFGDVAKGPYYGGKVKTIGKQEPNPVELINVSEEVNKGVNFITFFGHSSPSTIDIDIGFATDPVLGYNNPGKYPAFLINGCNAGAFFSSGTVFGEDWVMAANKGARSFIAHSSFGFVSTLRSYTQLFYEIGFGDSTFIRKGIGDIQKEVARRYLETSSAGISTITQVQQMMMLGDPAVKLFGALKPDYETNDNAIYLESFDGKPITALTDSFAVKVIARNFGSVSKANLGVRVTRTFNDQTSIGYDSVFNSPSSLDTLSFLIKREGGISGFGRNQFLVELDFDNIIDELDEDNNVASLELSIPLSGTRNLLPRPFGIVSQQEVVLKWQNTDLLSLSRRYDIELDTVNTFNSSFLKQATLEGKVLLEWPVTLLTRDSLAYYWRTKLADPQPEENEEWATSSFSYINNSEEGWAQVHFPQYLENITDGLVKDQIARELKFEETSATVFVNNFGANHPSPSTTSFKINDIEYNLGTQGQPCRNNTINFVAFNKTTLVPYAGIPFIFQDPRTCGREPQVINSFTLAQLDAGGTDDLLEYIDNINVSDSVVIFSIGNASYTSWSANVITKLGELGISAAQLTSLQDGEPVAIFGKKGSVGGDATIEKSNDSPADEQELQVSKPLTGKNNNGKLFSAVIGPANSWASFSSKAGNVAASDKYSFDLIGINLLGAETLLFSNTTGTIDLSGIDATVFPMMKLILFTEDEVDQTPIQLHNWIVNYEPVAEGVLLYRETPEGVEVSEGELWEAKYSFLNISEKLFLDSLQIDFGTFNKEKRGSVSKQINIKSPMPGDSTHFSFVVETKQQAGLNDVNVFVNNRILPEQYYENNTLELLNYLDVRRDEIAPVLEVTIDGRHVEDGDFVGSNPFIIATMWDENQFILKQDTLGVHILLKSPCEGDCEFESIYFGHSGIEWFPATDHSDFRIEYKPNFLLEGEYTLSVEITDGSGNTAIAPYEVRLNVDMNTALHFIEPYPTPSTGEVFFEFVVTGNQPPDSYQMQIFALDGRLVGNYSNTQSTHVGHNQLVWRGAENSETPLKGGMYIYKLGIIINGIPHFRNGKLIIVR